MTRAWIFQGNPGHYDLDGALEALDRIWWRVPQHTSEVHVGDVVVLWRSGSEAGVVGIGRVVAEPRLTPMDPAEAQFVLGGSEDVPDTTRALVRVRPVPYVSRETVRQVPALRDHQIVRAPMGTVFPLTNEQWRAVAAVVPDPPEAVRPELGALPPTWGWEQRAKGVLPMPGGYSGYLDSLEQVCAAVAEERPTPSELPALVERVLGVRATAARLRAAFLRKVGIVVVEDGLCCLSVWARRWRDSRDGRVIAALLHGRCRFVGEMLAAALESRTTDELLAVANEQYGMGWDTPAQVSNRRGWLQSSGMLEAAGDGMVRASVAGRALLEELTLHEPETSVPTAPDDTVVEPAPPADVDPAPTLEPSSPEDRSDVRLRVLIDELRAAATDSRDPDRLERAVRDAFAFLGFRLFAL